MAAFGPDTTSATAHYVLNGFIENRSLDSFDELGYIASHSDLIAAFGTDGSAATKHYIAYGSTEGRTVTFDASSYLAAHADLRAAFGTDQELENVISFLEKRLDPHGRAREWIIR